MKVAIDMNHRTYCNTGNPFGLWEKHLLNWHNFIITKPKFQGYPADRLRNSYEMVK